MKDKKTILTYNQALERSEKYCAYQERCQSEVRNKLYEWGLHSKEVESAIAELISNGFINEERFAKAFTSGKFRIKQWGRIKIKIELRKRKISEYCIKEAFKSIDEEEYLDTLKSIINKKAKQISKTNPWVFKNKLAFFMISKGYERDLVWETLESLG